MVGLVRVVGVAFHVVFVVDFGKDVAGVADGPGGVVEVGLGYVGVGADADAPALVEGSGGAEGGCVKNNGRGLGRIGGGGLDVAAVRDKEFDQRRWAAMGMGLLLGRGVERD